MNKVKMNKSHKFTIHKLNSNNFFKYVHKVYISRWLKKPKNNSTIVLLWSTLQDSVLLKSFSFPFFFNQTILTPLKIDIGLTTQACRPASSWLEGQSSFLVISSGYSQKETLLSKYERKTHQSYHQKEVPLSKL